MILTLGIIGSTAYATTGEWLHKAENALQQSDPGFFQQYTVMQPLEKAIILQDIARQQYEHHQKKGLVQNNPENLPTFLNHRMDFMDNHNLPQIPSEAQLIMALTPTNETL
jgi:hypothetical protein